MMLDDVIEIKTADPDSQYRLVSCKCSSDNVAYVHYNGRGGAAWRVECFDCGHTVDKGCRVRHDAQLAWNGLVQKENQILVVIKQPGQAPRLEPLFENTLEAFQAAVGGYIETVTYSKDFVIICNEEGRLKGLPFNVEISGVGFVGAILAVGTKGDEFASIKGAMIPKVMQIMGGTH